MRHELKWVGHLALCEFISCLPTTQRQHKSTIISTIISCSIRLLVDDLPDLQEVPEEVEPKVFQLDMGVSHQERHAHAQAPDTHWLTQLAVIATGPQSPLLQDRPNSR